MATTTPNFGWPVPTSTDLVKDGATAIEALGDSIDTSLLDLKGGTTNQVLTKNSATDMDFTWSSPSTSLSYATPFRSGTYQSTFGLVATSAQTATLNRVYYQTLIVPNSCTLDRISVSTATTFAGTASVRMGLYTMDGTGLPSTLVLDAGTVSCTAASTTYEITISQAVTPQIYFMAFCMQSAATTSTFTGMTSVYMPQMPLNNNTLNRNSGGLYYQSGITGAFANVVGTPTLVAPANLSNVVPMVRVA